MDIDYKKIENLFKKAEHSRLLEHEVYTFLRLLGIKTPEFLFIKKRDQASSKQLKNLHTKKVVLKIVSPSIVHKSDVGGVVSVKNNPSSVNKSMEKMLDEVPRRFQEWIHNKDKDIRAEIKGVLVCEAVEYESIGFGSEILLGLRNTREFGPIITMGAGGLDVEYLADWMKEGKALSISSPFLIQDKEISEVLESLAFYDKLTQEFRGKKAVLSKEKLKEIYQRFKELGAYFSNQSGKSEYVIEEAEVNPFVIQKGELIPLDGLCRISKAAKPQQSRPYQNIKHLLEPKKLAVLGVSKKMNIGHIILNNTLNRGFPKENITVIKPNTQEIEGCQCVDSVKDLSEIADLLVLAISAEQSAEVMQEVIESQKVRSVILIPGGIGEKEGTQVIEEKIKSMLRDKRREQKQAPVVNGGNCLGILSRPGKYDTTFIPEYKIYDLPRKRPQKVGLAILSQSGAFMVSRMSQMKSLEPVFAVSIGNQIDLTSSDYLKYLKGHENIQVFAVYGEGFTSGDGLEFAKAAQEAVKAGKSIVMYKGGRTPEGQSATAGHTASVAGDYRVSRAVLEQAGVFMADTIAEFQSFTKGLCFLKDKKVRGRRVALISNAGFECVIMSDSIQNNERLDLAYFSDSTASKLNKILGPLGINKIQDIRNPMDITPVADDQTFADCVKVIMEDENVDGAVVSPLPMTPAMNTLEPSKFHSEDLDKKGSTPNQLIEISQNTDKPFVVSIDAGRIYDPLVNKLEEAFIPVFSKSDEAVFFMRKYINHFLAQVR
ncbi:MAG: acetate--CoA ligase family protein [Acidobacteriota bacterium]